MNVVQVGDPIGNSNSMDNIREGIYRVVKSVASPLHFFAAAVIIMGGIIVVLAWKSTLPPQLTVQLITSAFFVLLALILLVTILVIFFPKKLIFDQEAHLTMLREQLGDNEIPLAGVPPNVRAPNVITNERE